MTHKIGKNFNRSQQAGFTLVELLMVSVLLFLLAYGTFTSVRSTMDVKTSIDKRTEFLQSNRAILELLDRDLRNVFFSDADSLGWNPILKKEDSTGAGGEGSGGDSSDDGVNGGTGGNEPAGENGEDAEDPEDITPPPPKPIPITLFQGTQNELLFSAKSHQRMSADVPENEQHFVRYRMEGTKLIREESYRAINKDDIRDDQQFRQFVVSENLESLSFQYFSEKADKWVDEWDTNGSENLDTLPLAVQVKVKYKPDSLENADPDENQKSVELVSAVLLNQSVFRRSK